MKLAKMIYCIGYLLSIITLYFAYIYYTMDMYFYVVLGVILSFGYSGFAYFGCHYLTDINWLIDFVGKIKVEEDEDEED